MDAQPTQQIEKFRGIFSKQKVQDALAGDGRSQCRTVRLPI